jgi:diguanylate cyclase (GGDEF)-like protein/PAS domain S-box-containing protein
MNVSIRSQHPDVEMLFEKLFACSPDAIVVVDNEGRILEANPQAEVLFGYNSSELLGNSVEVLIPQRFRTVHAQHRGDYRKNPRMRPMGKALELYGLRKNGTEFPVDVMLSPVETTEGHFVLCVIRDITERKRLEESLRQLASSDALTGLGNYRRLQEAFETEAKWLQRTGRSCALLLIDLDGLKKINDVHGHLEGDRALCRLADALRLECRTVDTPCRHGGDEFAVILPDTKGDGARNLASRVVNRLAQDRKNPEVPLISFSYGVAALPDDGRTLHQVLANADHSLYELKKLRR